jgi:hypothetical protein
MMDVGKLNSAEADHTTQRMSKPRLEGKYRERNISQEQFDYTTCARCTMRPLKKTLSVTQQMKVKYRCVSYILTF